jgi:hypothetical protein
VVRNLGRVRVHRVGGGLRGGISAPVVPMTAKSFVVHLVGSDDPKPFKHFELHHNAAAYVRERVTAGDADRADIYIVSDAAGAAAAVAAVKMGAAELLESRTPHATDAKIQAANLREWDRAVKSGPQAVLKFLGLI